MPSGAMTLLEAAKTMPRNFDTGVISTYAMAYHPMTMLPMISEPGGTHSWNLEYELAHTSGGARNINASFSATRSAINAYAENIRIYGGRTQIDRAIAKMSPGKVESERIAQIKAKAYRFTIDMFEGTGGTYLRGLDDWFDNEPAFAAQTTDIGSASAGTSLLTDHLDNLLNRLNIIPGRTFIYCSDTLGLRIRKLARGTNVSGDIAYQERYSPEQWGYFAGSYNGVPVVPLKDGKGSDLITTTRGDGSSTYVYGVTYGPDNYTGFQVGMPEVYPLGDNTSYNYFDLEHLVGTAPKSIRCIARLRYITNSQ